MLCRLLFCILDNVSKVLGRPASQVTIVGMTLRCSMEPTSSLGVGQFSSFMGRPQRHSQDRRCGEHRGGWQSWGLGIVASSHSPGQPATDAQVPGAGRHLRVGTRTALGAQREWLGPRKVGLGCGLGPLLCWLLCGCSSWSTFQSIPQPRAWAHPSLRGFLWVFVGEGPGFVYPTRSTEFLRKFVFSIRS